MYTRRVVRLHPRIRARARVCCIRITRAFPPIKFQTRLYIYAILDIILRGRSMEKKKHREILLLTT